MKNLSIIINLILFVAVAILYYLHFTGKPGATQAIHEGSVKNVNMAYVNYDSLLSEYEFIKNKKTEFEETQKKINESFKSEGAKLQSEINEYQKKATSMTDAERQQTEQQLGMKQQQLMRKKDDIVSNLDGEQEKTNEELYNRIAVYMKQFNKNKNYSFIFGHKKGGGILYSNDSLDITKDVIDGLNKAYIQEKEKK